MSLPALSDRGRGLSEIKGRDPMDRRIEVEKKERYGQALREQMAMNADKSHGSGSGFGVTAGGPRATSSMSRGFSSPAGCRFEGTAAPPGHQMPDPPTPSESNRMSGAGEANWGTSDKVAQVQDLMRQRISSVQEEQQRQWNYIQDALHKHSSSAAQAADDAIKRALDAASASQADELRRALEQVGAAQAESAAQSRRSEALQADLSELRRAVEQLRAQDSGQQQQLETHSREIESLKHAHDECARFRAEVQRQFAALQQQLEEHRMQMERLQASREEDGRALARLAEGHRAHGDSITRLQHDVQGLASAVGDVPGQIQQLRADMPRLAENAARAVLKGMKPPEPVVVVQQAPPAPVPVCAPDISENAFAALRNGDGEVFELPDLRNTVGRSPQCNACVSGSQQISNKHASINFSAEGQVSIQDLGSRNGTFLQDKRVCENGVIVESGDAIRLGADGPTFVFEYGPAFYARWPREPQRVTSNWGTAPARSQRAR